MKRAFGLRSSSYDQGVSVGRVKIKKEKLTQKARAAKEEERSTALWDDDSSFDKSISEISGASAAAASAADAAVQEAEALVLDEVDLSEFSEDLLAYEEAESLRSSSSLASSSLSSSSMSSSSSSAPPSPVTQTSLLGQLRARNRHLNPRYSHALGGNARTLNLVTDCETLTRAMQGDASPTVSRILGSMIPRPGINGSGSECFMVMPNVIPTEAQERIAEWARGQEAVTVTTASGSVNSAWSVPVDSVSYKDCAASLPIELQDALKALQIAYPSHTGALFSLSLVLSIFLTHPIC